MNESLCRCFSTTCTCYNIIFFFLYFYLRYRVFCLILQYTRNIYSQQIFGVVLNLLLLNFFFWSLCLACSTVQFLRFIISRFIIICSIHSALLFLYCFQTKLSHFNVFIVCLFLYISPWNLLNAQWKQARSINRAVKKKKYKKQKLFIWSCLCCKHCLVAGASPCNSIIQKGTQYKMPKPKSWRTLFGFISLQLSFRMYERDWTRL